MIAYITNGKAPVRCAASSTPNRRALQLAPELVLPTWQCQETVSIEGAPLSMLISHASCAVTWRITRAWGERQALLPISDVPRPAAMNPTLLQRPVAPLIVGLRQGAGDSPPSTMHSAVHAARYRIMLAPISRASAVRRHQKYMTSATRRCRRPVVM